MTDTVPREFVESLLYMFQRSPAKIVVGELAPNFPSEVDASGWTILGHVKQQDQSTITVFSSNRTDMEFVREVRTRFGDAGFSRQNRGVGGFSPNDYAFTQALERTGTTLHYEIRGEASGFFVTAMTHTLDAALYAPEADAHDGVPLPPMMPTLTNPVGTQITDGSAGSSGLVTHTAITLSPRIAVNVVIEHCASELREQGWREAGRDIDDTGAVVFFRHWTPECGPRTGTLSVLDDIDRDALQLTFSKCDIRGNPYKRRMYGDSIERAT